MILYRKLTNRAYLVLFCVIAIAALLAAVFVFRLGWIGIGLVALCLLLTIGAAIYWLYRTKSPKARTTTKPAKDKVSKKQQIASKEKAAMKRAASSSEGVREIKTPEADELVRCSTCRGRARIKVNTGWARCSLCNGRGVIEAVESVTS